MTNIIPSIESCAASVATSVPAIALLIVVGMIATASTSPAAAQGRPLLIQVPFAIVGILSRTAVIFGAMSAVGIILG